MDKYRIWINRSDDLAARTAALTLDLGDEQAAAERQRLRSAFNRSVVDSIQTFSRDHGYDAEVDFSNLVIGSNVALLPASPVFAAALMKRQLPHVGRIDPVAARGHTSAPECVCD
ncbi:MAG: hypothetical protein HYS17_01970 [Micavibrio aeruginosavorus]|uniref:Uncharacterized protein n=1 Tax=Micavibrio aeruginosavorus TaxID=349221 RepID=A0A7T5R2Y2_9BACT|nr:MAG: hypothetical protein HYS17_01970 [Micavibrio aeruginosavorus]